MGWRQDVERILWNLSIATLAVLVGVGVMWMAGLLGLAVLEAAAPRGIQGIGW